ncbi:MAG TPA: hypothetical protein VI583_14800 [Cyclobacteriaceae bacterium]|nr:hypothetical protein [Cyclobacteriaceae bacterium]
MDRRNFFKTSLCGLPLLYTRFPEANTKTEVYPEIKGKIITVKGAISKAKMGFTLSHEHVLVDFTGAGQYDPSKWNKKEVENIMQPYLEEVRGLGCDTMIDCTPEFLGRDPALLYALSVRTGLNILVPTGYYGAMNNKFLPDNVISENAANLASQWISEFHNGIGNTGIKPGFIKIGVDNQSLSDIHLKLVESAAITHAATGMVIASHTGGSVPAFEQLRILNKHKVAPSALIWVHSQDEKDDSMRERAARLGTWISLDGVNEENTGDYINRLEFLRQRSLLHKAIVSHDAGWYTPGKPGGGEIRGYTAIFRVLIPALRNAGFSESDIRQIFVKNPSEAFAIRKRMS